MELYKVVRNFMFLTNHTQRHETCITLLKLYARILLK